MQANKRSSFASKFSSKRRQHSLEAEMSFFDHLDTLRWHLIRSVFSIAVFTALALANKEFVFEKLILGPQKTSFWSYQILCKFAERFDFKDLCITQINFVLMNTELAGQFMIHLSASFLLGIALSFPYFVWEIWRFIKPALYNQERKNATGLLTFSTLLFLLGLSFGYFIIVPLTITFLGSYTVSPDILNQISLNSYLSTVATLSIGCGLVFELPIIVYFLAKAGLITAAFMRAKRRYAIVMVLIVAAFITPSPDMLTQSIVALPLYMLFEMSIFVSVYVERNTKEHASN